MKNNLWNSGWKYGRKFAERLNNWLLIGLFLWLPNPSLPTDKEPILPFFRDSEINLPAVGQLPVKIGKQIFNISARAVYIVDISSMVPLYFKNPDLKIHPASTTKIMTALTALEAFDKNSVVVSKHPQSAIGKTIKLKNGEIITFLDLLYGLLLESGNDAAYTLAENYPGGYPAMVAAMNQKAKTIGLADTNFKNVSGVDQNLHLSTARDLAILSEFAMRQDQFAEIVGTREKEIRSLDGKTVHSLKNTNELLGKVEGVLGIKTGQTELAGESLITYVERNDRQVILVVLGSQNRFADTKNSIDWVFNNFVWERPFID